MRRPPQYELYDLEADPYEFNNLARESEYEEVRGRLSAALLDWRRRTEDPLLKEKNLRRLRDEVQACFVDGLPEKKHLHLTYPDYFFDDDE